MLAGAEHPPTLVLPDVGAELPARSVRQDQAIVVIDRLKYRDGSLMPERLPLGWTWAFANTPMSGLYERLLASAGVGWAATMLPEEQRVAFDAIAAPRSGATIIPYAEKCRIAQDDWTAPAADGQGVYVFLNGHQFPLCDLGQALNLHRRNRCDVTVLGVCDARPASYDEALSFDQDGWVHRVERVYGAMPRQTRQEHWPAIMVVSELAMQQLAAMSLPPRMSRWPESLLRLGLRAQGATLRGRCFDLHRREHLHELAESILRQRFSWLCQSGSLAERAKSVWVGKNVVISPSAKVIGPAVIGDNVEVGPNALVIGPAVLGTGASIGPDVVLRRSLVLPGALVAAHTPDQADVMQGDPTGRAPLDEIHPPTLSRIRSIRIERILQARRLSRWKAWRGLAYNCTKRVIDLVGASLFLLVTLPAYPIIAIAIKINSPGPVFYGHLRQGRGGRVFRCWKFRTMIPNAEEIKQRLIARNEVDGPQFKMKDDPRTFRVGRWLRSLNIDEWPQFFNVLMGQMSLVGPRPSPERENRMCPAWREARLSVRPGITGLWQVSRCREVETDFQEWIYYDVQYVKRQSLWLDIKILLRTLRVILKGS